MTTTDNTPAPKKKRVKHWVSGPKPTSKSGAPKSGRTMRVTDECFFWCQQVASAGEILQSIFEDTGLRIVVERFMQEKKSEDEENHDDG